MWYRWIGWQVFCREFVDEYGQVPRAELTKILAYTFTSYSRYDRREYICGINGRLG